jgi:hypothetical protein
MEEQRLKDEDKKTEYFSEGEEDSSDDYDNPFTDHVKTDQTPAPTDPLSQEYQDFIRALPDCPMIIGFHVNVTVRLIVVYTVIVSPCTLQCD